MEAHIEALAKHPQVLHDPKLLDPTLDNDYDFVRSLTGGSQGDCTLIRSRPGRSLYVVKRMKDWDPQNNPHKWRKEMVFLLEYLKPHVNLVRPYAFDLRMWVQQHLYFEYCSGGDLQSLMTHWAVFRLPAPPVFLLHTFIQLVDAFAYLHHSLQYDPASKTYKVKDKHPCIVHCDVKLENILMRWPGVPGEGFPEIVLCDFGLAKDYTNGHSEGFDGTPGWFAPEIQSLIDQKQKGELTSREYRTAHDNINMDPPTDIYGLGLVMGTLFEPKFLERGNPSLCEFPQEMQDLKFPSLVAKCLETDPKKRWVANYDSKLGLLRHVEELRTIMDGQIVQDLNFLDEIYWGPALPSSRASSGMMEVDIDE